MRERDIERHLVRRVRELGGEVRKVQWVGRRNAPDRLVMLPAAPGPGAWRAPIWVELKAPGQQPTPAQRREHARMRAMGQRVLVIDCLDTVEELLA